jgi:hypothetical protein
LKVNAQNNNYSISVNSGITSLGNFDAGLFVFYQGKPGFLGLNYLPQIGLSIGVFKTILQTDKEKIDVGINTYLSSINLEYQVVSSIVTQEFEPFWSKSKLYFGFIGSGFCYSHKIQNSKFNYNLGFDFLFKVYDGLKSPMFDSLNYLQLSSPNGKPNLPTLLFVPYFGLGYSFKKIEIYAHWNQSINTLISVSNFRGKQVMYFNIGAKFDFRP